MTDEKRPDEMDETETEAHRTGYFGNDEPKDEGDSEVEGHKMSNRPSTNRPSTNRPANN